MIFTDGSGGGNSSVLCPRRATRLYGSGSLREPSYPNASATSAPFLMRKHWPSSVSLNCLRTIYDTKEIFQDLVDAGHCVRFVWILAHRGIVGNKLADVAVKETLDLPNVFDLAKCHYTNLYSRFRTGGAADSL